MEEIRNIVGDAPTEKYLVETIMKNNYDMGKSLDIILNSNSATTNEKEIKKSIEKGEFNKRIISNYTF